MNTDDGKGDVNNGEDDKEEVDNNISNEINFIIKIYSKFEANDTSRF